MSEIDCEKLLRVQRKAALLGRGFRFLFWQIIPCAAIGVLNVTGLLCCPLAVYWAGLVLKVIFIVGYGILFLKLSGENTHYRAVAVCCLILGTLYIASSVGSGVLERIVFVLALLLPSDWHPGSPVFVALLLTLPEAILLILAEYHADQGHAEVLEDADPVMSKRWRDLWWWYAGAYGILYIANLNPTPCRPLLLAGGIGNLAVGVIKVIYLYRSSKLCWRISADFA